MGVYQHIDIDTGPQDLEALDGLIRAVQRACQRGIGERLGRFGMSVVHWHALQAISGNPGLPQRQLARLTGHSEQAFATLMMRMLIRGYVLRGRQSGRVTTHEVTPLGRVMLDLANEIAHEVLALLFLGIASDERQFLQALLHRVLQGQWRLQFAPRSGVRGKTTPMNQANATYIGRDLAHVWHPCTQMKDHEALPPIPIRSGKGVWLEDYAGQRYLDAISSWWVNLFGHANPRINAAVSAQLERLEQVILAGFTHEPVIALSEALTALAPRGLTRCFYADNGSSAVEVAVKMSFHYWRNTGRSAKRRIITLSNSYHGETLGALAVGNVELYKEIYKPLLMDVITVPSPDCFGRDPGESWAEHSRRRFAYMEAALAAHAHEACAVIVEPLVQCAGNMRMYDPLYLTLLREACDRHEVHLIADEIAVGFGRTGTMFACEQAGIRPDFMCLSKGLTAGYLPLSTVMTTEAVYAAFYDDYVKLNAFLHSHSFTGNPLGCAAALASLAIFREDRTLERNRALAAHMGERASELEEHPHVAEVRQHGMILAIELVADKASRTPYPWQERRGLTVYRHALSRGVLLRPIGSVVYFMPPYVIAPDEIDLMVEVAREGIERATCA